MKSLTLYYSILCTLFSTSTARARLDTNILPMEYDATLVPTTENGKPVEVKAEVAVLNIRSIKEAELTYTLDIFLSFYWDDHRLDGPKTSPEAGLILDASWKSKLWTPDVNFKNSVSNRMIHALDPLYYITIYNKTRVRFSSRLSLDLLCEMDFSYYPHDTQTCFVDIMSLSHNNKSVALMWRGLHISSKLYMTKFTVDKSGETHCDKFYRGIGTLSCIRGIITLKRFVGHFVIQKYIPSTIIVVMCFVGFWIPANAYPARVALCITSLLALITQQMHNASMNVSYIMALNVWMLICISFVFMSLVELAISVVWSQRKDYLERKRKSRELVHRLSPIGRKVLQNGPEGQVTVDVMSRATSPISPESPEHVESGKMQHISLWRYLIYMLQTNMLTQSSNKIDSVSRILFPAMFTLSAVLYFGFVTA
ncbi:Glycine receptor subunit alphaZ1 [Halotydeus destructor]|nr:Glycine receptor subunit alphaZ1 [Halotydeus destructor]